MDPALLADFEATWAPADVAGFGGLVVGRGLGGGGRLSSVRTNGGAWGDADLDAALAQQDDWGEGRLIRVMTGDDALEQAAIARGMAGFSPTVILSAPIASLTETELPRLSSFALWPPLAIQRQIWEAHDIGAPRQAAMARVQGPRAALLARKDDRAAGTGFCGVSGPVAGLHALIVLPAMRGARLGEWMLRCAAIWARRQGAEQMVLAVSRGNVPALRLYERLGFKEIAGYVYFAAP